MQTNPMYYDGNGEKKKITGAAIQQSSVVITAEMRKTIRGNPYVFVK